MKILIINGHLKPEESYTQRFFYEGICNEPNVTLVELSKMPHFNGEELQKYDRIFFQFPIYWYSSPALLKQWMDDHLKPSFQFLKGKELGIIVFLGTSIRKYHVGEKEQFTIDEMFRPFQMIANYFNMVYLPIFAINQFDYCTQAERCLLLVKYQQHILLKRQSNFEEVGYWYVSKLKSMQGGQQLIDYLNQRLDDLEQIKLVVKEMANE